MKQKTHTRIRLACLLSVFAVFAQQAGAGDKAVALLIDISGGDAEERSSATYGGSGGRVIVKTGVEDINTGDGNRPLTKDITLTSGTYNYTYVYMDIEHGSFTPPTITIEGDVTINCQGLFAPYRVVGKFLPNQDEPPRVRINAGHPIITVFGMQLKLFHGASFLMSAENTSPSPVNSDGSGMHGGSVEFFTSEADDIEVAIIASGGRGLNRGDGGDGGDVSVIASGGNIQTGGIFVDGGVAIGAMDPGYGGTGGDGGSIYLFGIEIVNANPSSSILLSADGGYGGRVSWGGREHPYGNKGGDGGNGGGIAIRGRLSENFPATARGGNGGNGGSAYMFFFSQTSGSGRDGYLGGDGGDGGAPGTIVGLPGTTTPGNGGNGGSGSHGEAGHKRTSYPWGYDSPGGKGGAGGNGGKSGGAGAEPGKGGPGGNGGHGNPDGADGQTGQDGDIGDRPPAKPPTDGSGHYTYVLCVGLKDVDPQKNPSENRHDGDVGAEKVHDAFLRLPNVSLTAKLVRMNTSNPGNRESLIRVIREAAQRLRPGDTFVFYANAHGFYDPNGGNEPAVLAQAVYDRENDIWHRELTTGNEWLYLSRTNWTQGISDDDFTAIFAGDSRWRDVNKLFIINSCYSGGFWGAPSGADDLSSLTKVALIASAPEDRVSFWQEDPYGNRWGRLGQSLVKALNTFTGTTKISFDHLYNATRIDYSLKAGMNGYIESIGDSWGSMAPISSNLFAAKSDDFEFNLDLTSPTTPTITTPSPLSAGTVGAPYNQTLTASDGTPPYLWAVVSNSLPAGLDMSAASGVITGTPTTAATTSFTVRVTGTNAGHTEKTFSLQIKDHPYTTWGRNHFAADELADAAISGETADPDRDGIGNLVEYALGLDPKAPNARGLPTGAPQGGYLTLTYRQNKQATDISYIAEACGDLSAGAWSSNGLVETARSDNNSYWLVTVRDATPVSNAPCRFMRLRITQP